jgi:hypothetical protein
MELASVNPRSVPAWLAFRRPIFPTSPFLARDGHFSVYDYTGVVRRFIANLSFRTITPPIANMIEYSAGVISKRIKCPCVNAKNAIVPGSQMMRLSAPFHMFGHVFSRRLWPQDGPVSVAFA